MPVVTIDNRQVEVPPGTNLIEAARKLGIEIPHYCYHPALSIAGACRMCLVEIEKMPKLQIACNTAATDGMVVRTRETSEKVKRAVQGSLEFHLANHPLDCPVCDRAGECWLQDYYMVYGLYTSRFYENKVKKQKALPIGDYVILDAERCILCSRCVRFTREITKTSELAIFERGDRAEIGIYPGHTVDNNYSGNLIDICPVGALLDRDFRYQLRVWYLQEARSVCPGCANGCNVKLHYNTRRPWKAGGRRLLRLKPRYNEFVNHWWLCDEGRYGYHFVDENRIQRPVKRSGGGREEIDWGQAITEIATRLRAVIDDHGRSAVGVIASPKMTNEELYLAKRFFGDTLGITNIDYRVPPVAERAGDDFLLKADRNPNSRGAQELGLGPSDGALDSEAMVKAAAEGKIKALYIFGHDISVYGQDLLRAAAERLDLFVHQASNYNPTSSYAHYLLPAAVFAEKEGTWTNFAGRVQKIERAFPPMGEALSDWEIILRLAQAMGIYFTYRQAEDIFREIARQVPAFSGMSYKQLGEKGKMLAGLEERVAPRARGETAGR